MSGDVNGQVGRVADSIGDDWFPVRSVQPCLSDHRELSVIDPVQITFDRVDGQLSRVVVGRLVDDLSVCAVHPRDFDVGFVREDVGEVQVLGDPIDGDAAEAGLADTILDDVRQLATVGTDTENTVL